MIITKTITKKILENIVQETFLTFGVISCSSLLDSLKLLGFYYATNAGISINIEDLKTPSIKQNFILEANNEINEISKQWEQGVVSDTERFQTIIDSWNNATEALKNKIVDFYQNFDPTNNLYIMAFSGARGNMSQVRQLIGMRGLMSDQDGKIIDLPIQTNFREGLSSIDYIISSYGARKGIVDTALKTADSGYLTRRLIYVAQDLIIREKDCKTLHGIVFLLNKNSNIQNILGRTLLSFTSLSVDNKIKITGYENKILTKEILNDLKSFGPIILTVSSSLTCFSLGSICQKCYGWDLAHKKTISLGETVGIIAAQSIGEPGTQLTMRTFHTGGIFTGELLKQIVAPFSGKIIIPLNLKTTNYRTNRGAITFKIHQEVNLVIVDWKGKIGTIFLEIGSYLYITNSSFIRKNQLIAESTAQSILKGVKKLKPIYSNFIGEVRFENLLVRKILRDKKTLKINQDNGILWILSGKIFSIPKESGNIFFNKLNKNKPIHFLKLVSPYSGINKIKNNKLIITTANSQFYFNLFDLAKISKNLRIDYSFLSKNFQYIDRFSILAYIYFFPKLNELVYIIRKKESQYNNTYFLVTESDTWKINSDQINNFAFITDKKKILKTNTNITETSKLPRNGIFLQKDGFKLIFQAINPIFLSRGTILNYKQGDFITKKKVLANLVNYTNQTEDIVQGLPKIEELIEARKPKLKAFLANRAGVLLNSIDLYQELNNLKKVVEKTYIKYMFNSNLNLNSLNSQKEDKQIFFIAHSIYTKENYEIFNNHIYNKIQIPTNFKIIKKPTTSEFLLKSSSNEVLLIDGKISSSVWTILKVKENLLDANRLFKNKRGDVLFITSKNKYVFLEYLTPVMKYEIPLTSKSILEPGNFIDIGEPFTEGVIDVHELLHILYTYHSVFDGIMKGTNRSLIKFQILLVHSIQAIYQSQGINISNKHIEIIVKQMTSMVIIKSSGDTPLLAGEFVRFSLIRSIYDTLQNAKSKIIYKIPKFEPILRSTTNSSLSKDGFLSAAGFQETKRILTNAAIEGSSDWLRGLKESLILGRLIPGGSAFLNYKNYLDNVFFFKNN